MRRLHHIARLLGRRRAIGALLACALLAGTLAGCGSAQGPRNPLARSDAPEQVLRTLRLGGIEDAVVGEERGTAVARLQVPAISSAGDVEIAWQLAVTALAQAYPGARTYVVQLFDSDVVPLVEYAASGREARRAIENDDPAALRESADVRYLPIGRQGRAEPLRAVAPADGEPVPRDALGTGPTLTQHEVPGAYLDAKNRAASLSGEASTLAKRAGAAAARSRRNVPGLPAPGVNEDAGLVLAGRLTDLLGLPGSAKERRIPGAAALGEFAGSVRADADPRMVLTLRTWFAVVQAVVAERPFGSVIAPARESARFVAEVEPPDPDSQYRDAALADAILVAARSADAPADAQVVTRFIRGEGHDVDAAAAAEDVSAGGAATSTAGDTTSTADAASLREADLAFARTVLSAVGRDSSSDAGPPAISWEATGGARQQVAPATWLAYLRGDGRVFWLAGEDGPVALTDASLLGWAWSARRAHVVDSHDVGRVLSTIELR